MREAHNMLELETVEKFKKKKIKLQYSKIYYQGGRGEGS